MIKDRNSSIDFLRFIAAYTVATTHLIINYYKTSIEFEIISSMAVEVFFIISGFVLAPQIIKLVKDNKFVNYKIFLVRRWYRTIPLYVLSLVMTTIILSKFSTFDFLKYLLFVQNFFYIWLNEDYFSISWSLSVEEWFYIIFPIFLIFLNKILGNNNHRILISAIIFIIVIFLLRLYFSNLDDWGSSVRRVVIFRLDSIALGFILYLFRDQFLSSLKNLIIIFIIFTALSILTFNIFKLNISENYYLVKHLSHYAIAAWGASLVMFLFLIEKFIKISSIKNLNFFLGKISYSTYLFHLILIYIIGSIENINLITFFIIFTISQFSLSALLYYFFESPILNARPMYKYKQEL